MTTEKALALVRTYYDCWKGGDATYDEARLRGVLHERLIFESPTGRKEGVDEFLPGLARFTKTLKSREMRQIFAVDGEAAAIYDCALTAPVSTLRCAEFFQIVGERITAIRLVFDASAYK